MDKDILLKYVNHKYDSYWHKYGKITEIVLIRKHSGWFSFECVVEKTTEVIFFDGGKIKDYDRFALPFIREDKLNRIIR